MKIPPVDLIEMQIYNGTLTNFYDLSNTFIPNVLQSNIEFNTYFNFETDTKIYESTSFYLNLSSEDAEQNIKISSIYELLMTDTILFSDTYYEPDMLYSDIPLGQIEENDYHIFTANSIIPYNINLPFLYSELSSSEYINTIDFTTLDLKTSLDFSMSNYDVYLLNINIL